MKNSKIGVFVLGLAAAFMLAALLTFMPFGASEAASSGGGVFTAGRSYSVHLAGFDDRIVRVRKVSGKWIRVEDRSGLYWLNTDWILEFSRAK